MENTELSPKTIESFWADDKETITSAKKEARLKSLRREAEIAVAEFGSAADNAEEELENAIRNSFKGGTSVKSLFDLKRAAKIAKAKHTDALADYKEFFGEEPRLQ